MRKYDFEKMSGLWKDEARKITENGVFVAHEGNWDLWAYDGMVYSIPVEGSGAGASCWCGLANLYHHLYHLSHVCNYNGMIPKYWENVNYDFLGKFGIA